MLSLIFAVVAAIALAAFQMSYGPGEFDYQQFKRHSGQLLLEPYPALVTGQTVIPLVAPGKHGAALLVAGMQGHIVTLSAARIHRDDAEMLEVLPGSIRLTAGSLEIPPLQSLGSFTLEGEIVDSKCFLGVMNPGSGRVHRECAVRCISGGVPSIFVVRDSSGRSRFLYLTNTTRNLLDYVAEPVHIRGELLRRANLFYFRIAGISRR